MTTPIVRLYASEQKARDAYNQLRENGFPESSTVLVTPGTAAAAPAEGEAPATSTSTSLSSAVRAGQILGPLAPACAERLDKGRSLVATLPAFGMSERAAAILDACKPVDTDVDLRPARDPWGQAAPFSASLYWRVLSTGKPAPFSSAIGMPTLSSSRSSTTLSSGRTLGAVMPELISSKFAFSSLLGLPLLSRKRVMLGFMAIIPRRGNWRLSFGLPLLSRNPAPFSSLLSLPVLANGR